MLSGVDYSDATPDIAYVTRDRLGRPTMITDGTGTHNLAYRPDGQTLSASIPQVSGHSLGYGYDALGRRSALELHAPGSTLHATAYTYDAMSRLETVGAAAVATATYTRVPGTSLLNATTVNNGSTNVLTVNRDYDSLTRLESISSSSSSVPSVVKSFSYIYNDRDQRTRCTLADGSYWIYQYDTLGQVISGIKYDDDDVAIPGCTFGYDFDDIGNRKSATSDLTGTAMYDPNTLNQYESRTVPGIIPVIGTANADTVVKIHRKALGDGPAAFIVPDRTGDIFHKNIPVNNANGPVTEEIDVYCHKHLTGPPAQEIAAKASRTVTVPKSPETFTYDPDGNLTSDGLWTYTWDAENRLISATTNHANDANSVKLEFTYDYQSRRVGKKTYSWDTDHWSLITDHRFAYDGWNLVGTFNAANDLQQSFLWGEDLSGSLQGAGGVGGLLAVSTFSPQPSAYLPLYDGNGNIMAYVDASGAKVAEYEYDVFGRTIAKAGAKADEMVYKFSTKTLDNEVGLYYYGYRYYSHGIGRWLSRDPIEEAGGDNLYTVCHNDLINSFDLLGMTTYTLVVGTMYSSKSPHDGRIIDDKETVSAFWNRMKDKYENPPDVCLNLITDATTNNVVDAVEMGEVFIFAHGFPFFKDRQLTRSKSLWSGGFADEAFLEALDFEEQERERYLKPFYKEVEKWERLKKRYERIGRDTKTLPPYPQPHPDWAIDIRLEHFKIKAQMTDHYATMEMLIPRAPNNPKTNFVTFYGCYAGYATQPTTHGITVRRGHDYKRSVYFLEAMGWIERDLQKLIESAK